MSNRSKMDDYIEIMITSTDLKTAWKNFDIERLVIIREKLVWLLDRAIKAADEGIEEVINDGGTKKMMDAVNAAEKLLDMIDRLTGLKARVSLDTAIEEVSRAGYLVSSPLANEKPTMKPTDTNKIVLQKIKELYDGTAKESTESQQKSDPTTHRPEKGR